MTAHGMCGRFEIFESAHHFRIEFESGRPIRIRIESRSFAGPYSSSSSLGTSIEARHVCRARV